ncbi:UvrD-helicase domain-containing protein [Xanthobacter sp.]|uniref:UvrD-helicase domain-containing protein n=1 Tax=Xanthobacter sp. TaxID=35809 RepID=UPI0035B0CF88
MDVWRDVRLKARQRHAEARDKASSDAAAELVAQGLKQAGLQTDNFEPGTVYGVGVLGALERNDGFVRLAANLDGRQRAVVAAHELGHFVLHDETAFMIRSTEAGFGGQPIETGSDRVVAYSPRERQEVQADIFAQEFLLPADKLRKWLFEGRERPSSIAKDLGLPVEFVRMQAIRALLLPPLMPPKEGEDGPAVAFDLDPEQREAAEWDERPLILDAGPGTGKTRTLISRIKHLLARSEPPSSILALTFSNKAAAEMIERVERVDAVAAPLIWVGTFHAYGLELLRLHCHAAGLPADFKVLDESGQLALLESVLGELRLDHFQNLWDPTLELRPILRAISRAKDEMISDHDYLAAARAALAAATTAQDIERAEKAVEVGEVYEIYQRTLAADGSVDFGDLVYRSVLLLRERPDVRATVMAKHRHVLVDEYQDVNFASTELLDQITESGKRLWVVADPRQSIYRFRGAAPQNAMGFTDRYTGAQRRQLKTNYRSCETVVRAFARFGAEMAAAPKPAATWRAKRGRVGFVDLLHAPDLASEAAAIRDQIERLKGDGIGYEDQAILATTHLCLARFGRALQDLGVPVLYLGDLFERPEIRDLLSLVSLGSDRGGVGLVRVAGFPQYGVSRSEAVMLLRHARETGQEVIAACAKADEVPGLGEASAEALKLLARHLDGIEWKTSAWHLLSHYLLESSDYLRPLLEVGDVRSQQRLVAIYQLLKFCREHYDANRSVAGRRKLLDDIRRLERLDDDRQFRIVPPEASGIPAVRMMTVHASKGLEFRAVHLPQVATRTVPGPKRPQRCPAPVGMERLEISKDEHDAETECLFFVALSRARDVMSVSSATRYTESQTCNPSKFLERMPGVLPATRTVATAAGSKRSEPMCPTVPQQIHQSRHLDTYMKCPARYRYEVLDGLRGGAEDSAYLRFHGCVRQTVRWIFEERRNGRTVTAAAAIDQLEAIWAEHGPKHGFEPLYRAEARRMVEGTVSASVEGEDAGTEWTAALGGKTITLRPDRVLETASGVVAQRLKTGRKSKSEEEKAEWALMGVAAAQAFPGRRIDLEAFYPAKAGRVPIVPTKGGKAVSDYTDAIAGIEKGDFTPSPGRECPTCQYYFVCTSEDSF